MVEGVNAGVQMGRIGDTNAFNTDLSSGKAQLNTGDLTFLHNVDPSSEYTLSIGDHSISLKPMADATCQSINLHGLDTNMSKDDLVEALKGRLEGFEVRDMSSPPIMIRQSNLDSAEGDKSNGRSVSGVSVDASRHLKNTGSMREAPGDKKSYVASAKEYLGSLVSKVGSQLNSIKSIRSDIEFEGTVNEYLGGINSDEDFENLGLDVFKGTYT